MAPAERFGLGRKFKPKHTLFCCELRFVAIYALFGDLFESKTVFLGQEVHYYMVYIAYYTELNWQICNHAQKRRIFRENSKYAPGKNYLAIFASRESLTNSATLPSVQDRALSE